MGLLAAFGLAAREARGGASLSLRGTWRMETAYETLADGTRATAYGERPDGLMMVDGAGRYSVQIYRRGRRAFASGDKKAGTPDEYREAALGSSAHFGRVRVDEAAGRLIFEIEAASFPNWEGKTQTREYVYADGVLTYRVPASASADGSVATSVWRRVEGEG